MAKYFLYPDPGIYDTGAITTGTSNGTAFSSSSSIVNADRITDQSIGSAITDFDENDAIRINMGAGSSPNAIAFYHSAADDNDINIYFHHAFQLIGNSFRFLIVQIIEFRHY